MTTDKPFNKFPCPVCGYYGVGCICEEASPPKSPLIILIPEISPVPDKDTANFDEIPAYDNLDNEDMHFIQSAIRRFLDAKVENIDMESLNWHLQVKSLDRRLAKLQEDIDNAV